MFADMRPSYRPTCIHAYIDTRLHGRHQKTIRGKQLGKQSAENSWGKAIGGKQLGTNSWGNNRGKQLGTQLGENKWGKTSGGKQLGKNNWRKQLGKTIGGLDFGMVPLNLVLFYAY